MLHYLLAYTTFDRLFLFGQCVLLLPQHLASVTAQVNNQVMHTVLRQLYTPHSQHRPLLTGLSPSEAVIQTGSHYDARRRGNYREVSSVTQHQLEPQMFYNRFTYNENFMDSRHSGAGGTRNQSEHSNQGQDFVNYTPRSREVARSGNSRLTPSVIIRKSSQEEAARPFQQTFHPPPVLEAKDIQKSPSEEKVQKRDSQKVDGGKTVLRPAQSFLFSSQSPDQLLPTPQEQHSSFREKNKLDVVRPWRTPSRTETNNIFSLSSQTSPHGVSNRFHSLVVKSNLSPEKQVASMTDSTQEIGLRHRKAQSYLFSLSPFFERAKPITADRHAAVFKQRLLDTQNNGRASSEREKAMKEAQSLVGFNQGNFSHAKSSKTHNTHFSQQGASMDNFPRYHHSSKVETRVTALPAPQESDKNSRVSLATEAATNASKLVHTTKSIYGFRGFKKQMRKPVTVHLNLSTSHTGERTDSGRHIFDKGRFKTTNIYPSLSPKYSFGRKSTAPQNYTTPSPTTLDQVQTTSAPEPLGFNEGRPPLPDSGARIKSNPHGRQFQIYSRIYGLKGFGSRPLEGARALIKRPDKPARVQQGFEGLKMRNSQIWRPESSRIHRRYNKTVPGSNTGRKDQMQLSNTQLTPSQEKENYKIHTHLGLQPVQSRPGNASSKGEQQNEASASVGHTITSSSLRSAGDSSLKSERGSPNRTRSATVMAHFIPSAFSGVVRGQRVRGKTASKLNNLTSLTLDVPIIRKPPSRHQAVTYADILGSASFTSVRATTQTAVAPGDGHSSLPAATEQREEAGPRRVDSEVGVQRGNSTSRSPEANAGGDGGPHDTSDSDVSMLQLFLDSEGSGSGGFNTSGVSPNESVSKDLSELDYLRISAGNTLFKSMNQSHTEK